MALRKPRLVCAENQGDVGEDRGLGAKRPVQKHLLRRVRQMVGPANHVRDAHVDVIDHRPELVHGLPKFFVAFAGAQQDEIFDFVVGKLALAKHRVCKFGRPSNGHPKADRGFRPGRRGLAAAAGAAGNAARSASFWLFILSGLGVIAAGISVRRTVTEERAAACNAFLGSRAIQFRSPRLVERSLIPIHAQPFQAVDNALDEFRLVTLGVGVLDAQDHHPAVMPRKEPVEQGRAGSTDMQIAGGRRGKADTHARGVLSRLVISSGSFSAESILQCNESAGFRPTSRSWKRSNGIYEPFGVIVQSADPLSTGRLEDTVNARTARSWSSLRSEVAQGGNFGKSLKIP